MPGYYRKASALPISLRQREVLEQIVRRKKSQQQHVTRAQIILMGGAGIGNQQIADQFCVDGKTIYHWRERWLKQTEQLLTIEGEADAATFSKAMLSFLSDAPRPGTPVTYTAQTVCFGLSIPQNTRPGSIRLNAGFPSWCDACSNEQALHPYKISCNASINLSISLTRPWQNRSNEPIPADHLTCKGYCFCHQALARYILSPSFDMLLINVLCSHLTSLFYKTKPNISYRKQLAISFLS